LSDFGQHLPFGIHTKAVRDVDRDKARWEQARGDIFIIWLAAQLEAFSFEIVEKPWSETMTTSELA
jgi:hypothetical protein